MFQGKVCLRHRAYMVEGMAAKKTSDDQASRLKKNLSLINKYKKGVKTKVVDVRKHPNGDLLVLLGDELSMYRLAQHYKDTAGKATYGYNRSLKSFYVKVQWG